MVASESLRIEDAVNETCPWSGQPISGDALTLYRDRVVGFCNPGCRDKFEIAVRHFDTALQAELHLGSRARQADRG
ncbi:glutathione S-transferase [Aureimonas flava]|uniref:Glutathione S-transferase n=1 Tax=Aureimonas flava TaxID=2320271 RepID=A0A3A1WMT3_9HYPH|nr:glutathione S-transferase [Aureimonas flava]RIY01037.1 glutathione S-transferase [Aureimonas flava]